MYFKSSNQEFAYSAADELKASGKPSSFSSCFMILGLHWVWQITLSNVRSKNNIMLQKHQNNITLCCRRYHVHGLQNETHPPALLLSSKFWWIVHFQWNSISCAILFDTPYRKRHTLEFRLFCSSKRCHGGIRALFK